MLSRLTARCGAFVLAAGVVAIGAYAPSSAQPWPPGPGAAQAPGQTYQSQLCTRLEAQLAGIDRGAGGDPARAEQVRRYEEAASRQQAELDRMVAQSRRAGCEGTGFFLFGGFQSEQCVDLNRQISSMRGNLDRITVDLQRLRGGDQDRGEQRRSVMVALAQNNCGPQYRTAARAPGGFFDQLFGRDANEPSSDLANPLAQSGTVRTICVRTCDGFYFPISYATNASRFRDDEKILPAHVPGLRGDPVLVSDRRRRRRAGDLDQRPTLFGAAERVQVSPGVQRGMQLQAAGPKLGRRNGQGRGCRTRRRRRDGRSRQADVASRPRRRGRPRAARRPRVSRPPLRRRRRPQRPPRRPRPRPNRPPSAPCARSARPSLPATK